MSAKGATVLSKANTQLEDAQKNNELLQKKKLSLEAKRISSILENSIKQVEIAATLPAVLQLNSESGVEDKELSRALQAHHKLEEKLEALEGLEQELDEDQEGEAREPRNRERAQLERDIKNSVRGLLRLVRAHPEAICGLRAEQGMEVGESESTLITVLKMFHSNMVEKLLTTADEELQLALHKPVLSPPACSLEDIVSLEQKVAKSTKEVNAKISEKSAKIKILQSSVQGKSTQEAGMSLFVDKQCQSHIETSQMKQEGIQQDIDQLRTQLNNLTLENRQVERAIQEKNEKMETDIEYLLQIFDDEIEGQQADLDLIEMDFEKEEGELRNLEKPFALLEVETNQIKEKRRLAEEKRKQEIKELELKTKAAIFAQAWWRGYSVRKALQNKGAKSKKAKKGKGKKK